MRRRVKWTAFARQASSWLENLCSWRSRVASIQLSRTGNHDSAPSGHRFEPGNLCHNSNREPSCRFGCTAQLVSSSTLRFMTIRSFSISI